MQAAIYQGGASVGGFLPDCLSRPLVSDTNASFTNATVKVAWVNQGTFTKVVFNVLDENGSHVLATMTGTASPMELKIPSNKIPAGPSMQLQGQLAPDGVAARMSGTFTFAVG